MRTHSWQSEAFWQQLTITPLYNEGKQCNKVVKWLPKTTENAGLRAELRFPVPSMLCQTEIAMLPSNTELFNLTMKRNKSTYIWSLANITVSLLSYKRVTNSPHPKQFLSEEVCLHGYEAYFIAVSLLLRMLLHLVTTFPPSASPANLFLC